MAPDPRIAVCPGSYDPVTYGHVDIISRASALFDEVIVAVVNASVRKTKPLFDAEDRIGFIERATAHLDHVRIEPFATARGRSGARARSPARSSRDCARSSDFELRAGR